jgi:predicted nuclease of predicted toxin-antitoxin system
LRLKLDENLPASATELLRGAGHEVDTARSEGLAGQDDSDVLEAATRDERLLITLDRGMGDIRHHPPGSHGGVLVLRLDHQSPRAVRREIERIRAIDLDDLSQCVAVWRYGDLRVRRPSS